MRKASPEATMQVGPGLAGSQRETPEVAAQSRITASNWTVVRLLLAVFAARVLTKHEVVVVAGQPLENTESEERIDRLKEGVVRERSSQGAPPI